MFFREKGVTFYFHSSGVQRQTLPLNYNLSDPLPLALIDLRFAVPLLLVSQVLELFLYTITLGYFVLEICSLGQFMAGLDSCSCFYDLFLTFVFLALVRLRGAIHEF